MQTVSSFGGNSGSCFNPISIYLFAMFIQAIQFSNAGLNGGLKISTEYSVYSEYSEYSVSIPLRPVGNNENTLRK